MIEFRKEHFDFLPFGQKIHVITFSRDLDSNEYFIGTELAKAFGKETFNMYKSFKAHGITVLKQHASVVDFLLENGIIKKGVHSMTLVDKDEFVERFPYSSKKKIISKEGYATRKWRHELEDKLILQAMQTDLLLEKQGLIQSASIDLANSIESCCVQTRNLSENCQEGIETPFDYLVSYVCHFCY